MRCCADELVGCLIDGGGVEVGGWEGGEGFLEGGDGACLGGVEGGGCHGCVRCWVVVGGGEDLGGEVGIESRWVMSWGQLWVCVTGRSVARVTAYLMHANKVKRYIRSQ